MTTKMEPCLGMDTSTRFDMTLMGYRDSTQRDDVHGASLISS